MRPVVPWSPIRSVPTSNERNHPRALRKRLVSELSVLLSVEASTLVAVCRLTRRRRRTDLSIACAASLACIRFPLFADCFEHSLLRAYGRYGRRQTRTKQTLQCLECFFLKIMRSWLGKTLERRNNAVVWSCVSSTQYRQ
jgi:hypothetical protein